jgi:hypothetical protein
MTLMVSALACALGTFIAVSPARAAEIWGAERLEKIRPGRKRFFLWGYRALGITMVAGGLLSAVTDVATRMLGR